MEQICTGFVKDPQTIAKSPKCSHTAANQRELCETKASDSRINQLCLLFGLHCPLFEDSLHVTWIDPVQRRVEHAADHPRNTRGEHKSVSGSLCVLLVRAAMGWLVAFVVASRIVAEIVVESSEDDRPKCSDGTLQRGLPGNNERPLDMFIRANIRPRTSSSNRSATMLLATGSSPAKQAPLSPRRIIMPGVKRLAEGEEGKRNATIH